LTTLALLGSPGGSPFHPNSGRLTTVGMFTEEFLSAPLEALDISGATGKAYALLVAKPGAEYEMHVTEMSLGAATTGPRARPPVRFATDIGLLPTSLIRFGPELAIFDPLLEGETRRIGLERGGPGTGPVSVNWAVGPQTAAEDLSVTAGTVSFAPGETLGSIEIPIANDRLREGSETFSVVLGPATGSAAEGAVVEGASERNFTIEPSDLAGPRLGIGPKRVRLDRRGRARLRLQCPASAQGACSGSLKLKLKKRTVGKRRFNVAAGRSKKLRLRISRRGRRALARRGRLRVTAVASTRDAVSAAATSRRKLVLLPPR
jgi:hypothetical protein